MMMSAEYSDLLDRIEALNTALRAKEKEACSLGVRNSALERELKLSAGAEHEVLVLQQVGQYYFCVMF